MNSCVDVAELLIDERLDFEFEFRIRSPTKGVTSKSVPDAKEMKGWPGGKAGLRRGCGRSTADVRAQRGN